MKLKSGAIAVLAVLSLRAAQAPTPAPSQFIWISDVHFNPLANPKLASKLAQTPVDQWASLLSANPPLSRSGFGADTDWALLSSAFSEIRKTAPQAQFTVVTGDIFVHNLGDLFQADTNNFDAGAVRSFSRAAFEFVAMQLRSLAPGKPVLFTLGNNDEDTCDYDLQPGGEFLSDTNDAVQGMLGQLADSESAKSWLATGTYNVAHPVVKKARIISLSSAYLSHKYRTYCGSQDPPDPGGDELTWLSDQLSSAKQNGEKVWLIFHIPPGIDGFATSHPKNGGAKVIVPMWQPNYTAELESLLGKYSDTVVLGLGGHEHMDDFRLIDHSVFLLAPAISPVVNQNPAFRSVTYNDKDEVIDATTYYLTNLNDFVQGKTPIWKPEYSFDQDWGMKGLDFASFSALFHSVETDPAAQDKWMNYYGVSHPAGHSITSSSFPWMFCAAGNVTAGPFDTCVQRVLSSSAAKQ